MPATHRMRRARSGTTASSSSTSRCGPSRSRPVSTTRATATAGLSSPLAARGACARTGQGAIPLALVVLNLLAVAVGTWAARRVAAPRAASRPGSRFSTPPFPGVFFGVWRNLLSEPLAYALTAVALLVFAPVTGRARIALSLRRSSRSRSLTPERRLLSSCSSGLQLPRRSGTTPVGSRSLRDRVASPLPRLYRFVFLNLWLGTPGLPAQVRRRRCRSGGIGHYFPWQASKACSVCMRCFCRVCSVLPSRLAALLRGNEGARGLGAARERGPFVVLLPAAAYVDYASAGRISTSVVLAFLLSLPALTRVFPTTRAWMYVAHDRVVRALVSPSACVRCALVAEERRGRR